jgi:hypothetical protein
MIKSRKEVSYKTVGINTGIFYYFFLMIEGSGSGPGSVSLTNGSGYERPKNIWILRIRIRNTPISYVSDVLPRYFTSGDPAAEFGGVPGTADGQAAALSLQHAQFTPGTPHGKNNTTF